MAKYSFTNKSSTPVTVIGRRKIEIAGLAVGQEVDFSEKDIQKILPILKRKHFLKIEKVGEKKSETPKAEAAAEEAAAAVSTLSASASTAKSERYRKRGRPAKTETAATAEVSDVAEA